MKHDPFDRKHVEQCEACASQYDKIARIERVLEKTPISERALAAIEANIMPKRPWFKLPQVWAGAAALAGALSLLVVMQPGEFAARGGGLSVKALCVRDGKASTECHVDDLLQIVVNAQKPTALRIHGVDDNGKRHAYFPEEGEAEYRVNAGETVLPAIDLKRNHTRGRLRIFSGEESVTTLELK